MNVNCETNTKVQDPPQLQKRLSINIPLCGQGAEPKDGVLIPWYYRELVASSSCDYV